MTRLFILFTAAFPCLLYPSHFLAAPFEIASQSCPMAHCDPQMSDLSRFTDVPRGKDVKILWSDTETVGSLIGLGCTSNGVVAACTFNGATGDNLIVYDASGKRLWSSNNLLNAEAWKSAPLVDNSGGVIATDNKHIIRFDPKGKVLWQSETEGAPISPVPLGKRYLLNASNGGPLTVYDSETGELITKKLLIDNHIGPGYFDTVNTPGIRNNRIYLSAHYSEGGKMSDRYIGRLYAIDFNPTASFEDRLQVKWYFEFGGRSGASVTLINNRIYFDGHRLKAGDQNKNPHAFAIEDLGENYELLWSVPFSKPIMASPAVDPRGGLWFFGRFDKELIRLEEKTGAVLEIIDVNKLVGDFFKHGPLSALTITGERQSPVLLLGASAISTALTGRKSYLIAIDLLTSSLIWKVRVPNAARDFQWPFGATIGQFPVLSGVNGKPVVVFTSLGGGAFGVGSP